MENWANKKLPFSAIVKGDWLECYGWKNEEKLEIVSLLDDLDSKNNEYLWKAKNIDRNNEIGAVGTSQIHIL